MHVTCSFCWKVLQGAWKLEPNQELWGVTCGDDSSAWFDQEQICLLKLIVGDIAATCKECLGFTRIQNHLERQVLKPISKQCALCGSWVLVSGRRMRHLLESIAQIDPDRAADCVVPPCWKNLGYTNKVAWCCTNKYRLKTIHLLPFESDGLMTWPVFHQAVKPSWGRAKFFNHTSWGGTLNAFSKLAAVLAIASTCCFNSFEAHVQSGASRFSDPASGGKKEMGSGFYRFYAFCQHFKVF